MMYLYSGVSVLMVILSVRIGRNRLLCICLFAKYLQVFTFLWDVINIFIVRFTQCTFFFRFNYLRCFKRFFPARWKLFFLRSAFHFPVPLDHPNYKMTFRRNISICLRSWFQLELESVLTFCLCDFELRFCGDSGFFSFIILKCSAFKAK